MHIEDYKIALQKTCFYGFVHEESFLKAKLLFEIGFHCRHIRNFFKTLKTDFLVYFEPSSSKILIKRLVV